MSTEQLIAEMKAADETPENIAIVEKRLKEKEADSSVGKQNGSTPTGVDVVPENAENTPTDTESPLENTSSELQEDKTNAHLGFFLIGEEKLTLDQVKEKAGDKNVSTYLNENNGKFSDESNVLPEVKVTPLYEEKNKRADALLKQELDEIFKVYKGASLSKINANKAQQKFDTLSDDEISEEDTYFNEHSNNPLTGLEEVKEGFNVIGVKRKGENRNGNQTLTSSELQEVGLKIKKTLELEDEYIGGSGEDSFNFKTIEKTKEERNAYAVELRGNTDFNKPGAVEEFMQAIMLKDQEIWSREALADEEYQYRSGAIESTLENKFKAMLINKHIEEQKSFLIPDGYENAGTVVRKLYEFFKYQLPSSKASSSIAANGESMYKITEQLKQAQTNKYTDKTKGYVGKKGNELVFIANPSVKDISGMVNSKRATWAEAKLLLEEESNKYGAVVMSQMASSREYQEKLATLGTPEILNESWEWDLDTEGYKELIGTQLGQMTLGALTFGGSTFMQELGGMTQEAISLNAALLHSGRDSKLPISGEEKIKIQQDFYKLSPEEQDKLSMEVLKSGMIDFDKFYSSAARSAGLDLVGNFFVIGKGAKLIPKQLVNGFMAKNLKQIYGGLKGVVGRAAGATVGEMLTEGLQNLNSQATVSNSAALHTFDSRGLANETLMAAVVPGPLVLVGQSAQIMTQAVRLSNMDVAEASYNAWFDKAENNINVALKNGQIKQPAADKALAEIGIAREVLSNQNLKDVKTVAEREIITNSLVKSAGYDIEILELQSKLDLAKKGEDKNTGTEKMSAPTFLSEKLQEEINVLNELKNRETTVQVKEKAISHYLTNSKKQEHWQNQQTEGTNENRFTKIFKTTEEAKAYILENFPEQLKKFDNLLLKGAYGANAQNITLPDGTKISYNFAITDNVIKGIKEGDLTAGNVINHEQGHDNLQAFDTNELVQIKKDVMQELANSKDPEIQKVVNIINQKLAQYKKSKGTRNEHEEFYTAMSDAFHALDMVNLSLDGKTTLSLLGSVYAKAFGDNVGPIVNWKEGFDKLGVVDFIKSYTLMTEDFYADDVIEGIRGGKEPNLTGLKKNSEGIYVQDSRRVYPTGRTSGEIKQANSVLAEELLKEQTSPRYTNEADPVLEANVRAGEKKKLEGELVANNMGLINLFLKHKSNGGLYFDPAAGDINYDDFSEAVMGEVGTIINTYTPYDKNGKQQDFGSYLGGLMDKRIPGIWQKLVGDQSKEFTQDSDNRQDEQNSDYDDFVDEFDEQVITLGGEDMTVKAATSEMRKTLGIKEGDQLYNEILDDVIEVLITDFAAVNEEGFYLDTKDKIAAKLFKKLKTQLGSPKSDKYKEWLNENIQKIYNLLPQSVFNKSYEQYTIKGGRANVEQSIDKDTEFEKGVKIKSATAGNEMRSKMPYTDEIGEQFILELLDPKKQGLKGTPASKQDGLVTQLGSVIGTDAISTAINSSAFKDAHGDQEAIMGHVADVINRDMSVQFSNKTLGIEYNITTMVEHQQANKLIRALATSGIVGDQESKDFVNEMATKLGYSMDAAGFVIHLDSKGIIEKGESTKFKGDLTKWLEGYDSAMAIEFKADGSIGGKKAVLDRIADDVTKFTGGMDPEMLDALGFDIFAFHRRVLNAAETQQGPKRILTDRKGKIITVQKQNKKFPDGNQSYADATTTLKLEGWTFNQKNNKFVHNEGRLKDSADPVKDHGAVIVSAPYFETLQNIKRTNEAKKQDPSYTPTGKYDNVRIMNMGVSGGLFKKIGNILNDKTILTRKARIDKIVELYGPEIEAANKANMELATDISIELIEAVKDDKINTTTFFHMLQSQTNLAYGFRGLTKLQMISVLEGTYKEQGGRAYGEHINPNSSKMLELAKIGMRAKKDPDYNYMEAVAVLFSDHDQVLFTSGDAKTIDTSKLLSGPTSTASYDRLKALTPQQRASFVGYNGESYKEAMVRINATNNILIETAKKKFESQRKVIKTEKKAKAVKNILLKNTSTGVVQGASVFDFDGTLEKGGKNIIVATNPKTGKVVKVLSHDFHNQVGALIEGGFEFNFDDFVNVKDSKQGPMFQKLLNQIEKYGVENIHILTARQPGAALAIDMWLKQNGVNLMPENITGLGVLGPDGKPITVTGKDKADWIESNLILNGFNDIYFVDDGKKIVDAVDEMFATYPKGLLVDGGKSVLVDPSVGNVQSSLTTDFNNILEVTEGIDAVKVYSKAQGDIQGANAGNFIVDTLYPPSAYDFEMFTYKYMTKGKEGEKQAEFFKENIFIPYEQAIQAIDKQKKEIKDDYSALVKELPQVEKNLNANIEGTNYSSEQAVRVYIWSKQGVEIPGISKRDQKALVAAVSADPELIMFADRLSAIAQQRDGYVKPTEYWTIESIAYDLADMTGGEGRAKHLALWKENVGQIFSEENKSKLKVAYGKEHVEALEDMLYRMEYGRNKNKPGRVEQEWNNWVNNSVGAVMFFNMRSAALQTISAANYIDWENNHPGNAALAFANQPQFWKDFSTIYNSDYLVERRSGSKRTVNEAELVTHLKGKTNKAKAALAWLLEKGFTPTQIADSFAIASGGASYYRNQIKAYEKSGMTSEDAETQAFLDLRDKTEKGQQSSRADMISQQQAGGLGRIILAFKNTPMQYNRIMIKALADIKNKRGSLKGNLSKVAYYGVVQSVIFNSLQTALFSALGDEDEWDKKTDRIASGMIDGILGGMGLTGAVAATVKNGYLMYKKQKAKGFRADHARTVLAFANLSPTIGSKLRKLYGGIQTEAMNEGAIEKMGLTIENPAFAALANIVSATTNIPADRVVGKINNIILASSSEMEAMDRIALLMGWNAWDLGLTSKTKAKQANIEFKKEKKEEKKAFDFQKKNNYNKTEEQKNIVKQKEEKKEGKKVTCSYNTSKGRCGVVVEGGGTRCTIHEEVEQRKDGKKPQCTHIKKNGKRCGVMTANKSGLCYYHD